MTTPFRWQAVVALGAFAAGCGSSFARRAPAPSPPIPPPAALWAPAEKAEVQAEVEVYAVPVPVPPNAIWAARLEEGRLPAGLPPASTRGETLQSVAIRFPRPVTADAVVVLESENPGAIVSVEDHSTSPPRVLSSGGYPVEGEAQWNLYRLPRPHRISRLRLLIDPALVAGETAIEAVGLLPTSRPSVFSRHLASVSTAPARRGIIWASEVLESSYPARQGYTADRLLGPPRSYPSPAGDPRGLNNYVFRARSTVTVAFSNAVLADRVVLLETLAPGSIMRIENWTSEEPQVLWQRRPYSALAPTQQFPLKLDPPQRIRILRVAFDAEKVNGWESAIDAIGIEAVGAPPDVLRELARLEVVQSPLPLPVQVVWASRLLDATPGGGDEKQAKDRGPEEVLGAPDVYPVTAEAGTWGEKGARQHYVEVGFPEPVWTREVVVVEPNGAGTVRRVEDRSGGGSQVLWEGGVPDSGGHQCRFVLPQPRSIEALRVVVDGRGSQFNPPAIDAIGLVPAAGRPAPIPLMPPPSQLRVHPAPEALPARIQWSTSVDVAGTRYAGLSGPDLYLEARRAHRDRPPKEAKWQASLIKPAAGTFFSLVPDARRQREARSWSVATVAWREPVVAQRLVIVEFESPGAIAQIESVVADDAQVLWRGIYSPRADQQWLEVELAKPTAIEQLRISFDGRRVKRNPKIDAVGLVPAASELER